MELKDEDPVGRCARHTHESIQWNWKALHRPTVRPRFYCGRIHSMELKGQVKDIQTEIHHYLVESIQWNWKWSTAFSSMRLRILLNPFNGIESRVSSSRASLEGLYRWIHSMELKVFQPPLGDYMVCSVMNPFNGIERCPLASFQFCVLGESIQWNWKVGKMVKELYRQGIWIHSMELKDKGKLINFPKVLQGMNPFNGIERSINIYHATG